MLGTYLLRTTQLLQNPAAPTSLYSTPLLTSFINVARGQLAAETSCIRRFGTVSTVVQERQYDFSEIDIGTSTTAEGVINVRAIRYTVGDGFKWIRPRPWEWFDLFKLNNPVPPSGAPEVWSQYRQGSSPGLMTGESTGGISSGTFLLDPIPDIVYTLTCDCACYPAPMASNSDEEGIPYLFTDAVPYFAAYLALMSAQTNARIEQAQRMLDLYNLFVARANRGSAPDVNRYLYERQGDGGTGTNKLGVSVSKDNA